MSICFRLGTAGGLVGIVRLFCFTFSTVTSLFPAGAERADSVCVQFLEEVFGVSLILGRFDFLISTL